MKLIELFEKKIFSLFEDSEVLTAESEKLLDQRFTDKFITTLKLGQKEVGSFIFTRYSHVENNKRIVINNYSSVNSNFRNLGYGKILLLAAIASADHYHIIFEKDNSGISPTQKSVYDSLLRSGYITQQPAFYDMAGFEHREWRLTTSGLDFLNHQIGSINFL